jgi:hypothetical protein
MNGRSIRSGALAGAGLVLFYVVVVAGASGSWDHLADQARRDWYFLVAIIGGFAEPVQVDWQAVGAVESPDTDVDR